MMTSEFNEQTIDEDEVIYDGPSKSQVKRECHHLLDVGDSILKLKPEEIRSLDLPTELEEAVATALKIKSRSGLKRQRQYIGKLLRSIDSADIEAKLNKIQHSHDTNTAQFKRLEKWRDNLVDNDKDTLNDVISRYPDIDRQHLNQLIRTAHQEKSQNKAPAAARKLFKYLRELEES
jgi:ribosome-associated protein